MTTLLPDIPGITAEIESIGRFYALDGSKVREVVGSMKFNLGNYTEIVFTATGFELITAGKGDEFSKKINAIAGSHGLPLTAAGLFLECAASFPSAILGIKVCFDKRSASPSVYVRTKCSMNEGYDFLQQNKSTIGDIGPLKERLRNNKVLYGLGFFGSNGALGIKTYTIDEVGTLFPEVTGEKKTPGFVSHRLVGGKVLTEAKEYLPEIRLAEFQAPSARWKNIIAFLRNDLGYETAGHIGLLHDEERQAQYKIYIERTGGIPTDFSAK